MADSKNPDDATRYVLIMGEGYKDDNYLLYSIELIPKEDSVPAIVLKGSAENAGTPSTPKPTLSPEQIVKPTESVYEITLSNENETEATKDKDSFRTNVEFYEDGSVSYTNVSQYDSGMVFSAAPDGKVADLSDFDYVEVELDGPADAALKCFNDASWWWNKIEVYEGLMYSGRRTIHFSLQWMKEKGLNTAQVDGFAIGFNTEDSPGQTVRIYSIRVGKYE